MGPYRHAEPPPPPLRPAPIVPRAVDDDDIVPPFATFIEQEPASTSKGLAVVLAQLAVPVLVVASGAICLWLPLVLGALTIVVAVWRRKGTTPWRRFMRRVRA
jgi:hypothetical protein